MSKQDKKVQTLWEVVGESLNIQRAFQDGVNAGREAERERVLGIIHSCLPLHTNYVMIDSLDWNRKFDEITRRIKEQEK